MKPISSTARARKNRKVCFICGAGHSGSTLLGMVLGSHADCFYAGEASKTRYLDDPDKPVHKRQCKLCGPNCRIWADFTVECHDDLYEQITAKVGRSVVIDSTKNVNWIRSQLSALELTEALPYVIFLQRDGRAVLNSRVRKYPQKCAEEQIRAWVELIEATKELYETLAVPKMIVRYERFATDPLRTTREICAFLGLEFDCEMLAFHRHEHHPLGGNNGTQYQVARHLPLVQERPWFTIGEGSPDYYEQHEVGIKLDLRWQSELRRGHLDMFEQIAGDFNEPMSWEG